LDSAPEGEPKRAEPVTLTGVLQRFRFRNPDSGFGVARLEPEDGGDPIDIVGEIAQLPEGQRVAVAGRRVVHPRFGAQVEVDSADLVLPSTTEGIEAYLASHLVKGIGPATAKRIVERFGTDTLQIIEQQPERLREVRGLGQKKSDELVAAVRAQHEIGQLVVFLRTHGLGQGLAGRIARHYGAGAAALVRSDPYRLAEEVIGIGFKIADRLAHSLGIAADSPERIQAGVLHTLANASKDGHCFLPQPELCEAAAVLLGLAPEQIEPELPPLATSRRLVIEPLPGPRVLVESAPPCVYPVALHAAETSVARRLALLAKSRRAPLAIHAERAVEWYEQRSRLQLATAQRQALIESLRAPVTVITGGPGVGKTTIVRALVEILAQKNLPILLAAPTGRAAKRLEESTGRTATTLHRLLEYQPGLHKFQRDAGAPLEAAMLVVDEVSMLDVQLADALLRAVPVGLNLVLVGDVDQLPAVGPGNVLRDVIDSGLVAVVRLNEVFRQQKGSSIVGAAHAVLAGRIPEGGSEGSDFYFVETRDSEQTRLLVQELVLRRIPRAFGFDPMRDIQVLCPMYRGPAGADSINRDLQDLINPGRPELERGGRKFREGDKVMQIRNDYELDLFNGDIGRIQRLDKAAAELFVTFQDRSLRYPLADLDQLVPAYAISVHRAQGSEYPASVLPLATDHFMMLRRNLLYTAITRGKRLVVLVGSPKALATAVRNDQEAQRYSGLTERLRAAPGSDSGSG
jgi:exodeoxyribonuclease V alpha subunit